MDYKKKIIEMVEKADHDQLYTIFRFCSETYQCEIIDVGVIGQVYYNEFDVENQHYVQKKDMMYKMESGVTKWDISQQLQEKAAQGKQH